MPIIDMDSVNKADLPPADPLDHFRLLSECEKNARLLEIRLRLYKDFIHEEERSPSTAIHPLDKDIWPR
ncbi:hypothetical protein TNCT_239661 [Trichonephila clavata]|uniref:Uncharacterized protein n=1 Tax=Trichonephila clavata TaxID=2740835 RepID=A0A8X6KSM9_TRICU|nr:hypothetical protein TNCT_239661 [Trichonephila clavata]